MRTSLFSVVVLIGIFSITGSGVAAANDFTSTDWQSLLTNGQHGPAVDVTVDGSRVSGHQAASILHTIATVAIIEGEGRGVAQTILGITIGEANAATGISTLRSDVSPGFATYFHLLTNQGATPLRSIDVARSTQTITVTVGPDGKKAAKPFVLGGKGWAAYKTSVRRTRTAFEAAGGSAGGTVQLPATTTRSRTAEIGEVKRPTDRGRRSGGGGRGKRGGGGGRR